MHSVAGDAVTTLIRVQTRFLVADGNGSIAPTDALPAEPPANGWVWIDALAGDADVAELIELTDALGFDRLAVRDAVLDVDMPKTDDFGTHVLVVLHGLRGGAVLTYEIDFFVSERTLLTVHDEHAVSVDAVWNQVQHRADLAKLGVDELVAVIADAMTRRLLSVLEAFDDRVEELVDKALRADPTLLEDLTAVRTDLASVRRVVHPQREALDVLRRAPSPLITDAGRRRFSDVFDVAARLANGLDEARSALAETLDAYRGAEARQATDVTKVLTVYAAIMLPLSLIAGIFGMNFANLPLLDREWGWIAASALMLGVALVSLGVFISLGWVRRPSGRRTGRVLGRGLLEASLAPVQIVGAVFEMSTMPIRATGSKLRQVVEVEPSLRAGLPRQRRPGSTEPGDVDDGSVGDGDDDYEHHGSE